MSVAFRIIASPPPGPRPAQPTAVDPLRILELRVRAEMAIEQIDRALHSSGDAAVGLVQPPRQPDRLAALLTVTTVTGPRVQIELQLCDVAGLASDLIALLAADAARCSLARKKCRLDAVAADRREMYDGRLTYHWLSDEDERSD
jgi:hypothetical protein